MEQPNPIQPKRENDAERMRRGALDLFVGITGFFRDLINLQEGLDREGTIVDIKNNKRMRGANAWLLMCSIMVASLGLDLNSPAVIIGAMLISPLMSPILGIGLAVGINDREMLTISLQHFGIAIGIALVTSVVYFQLTPLGDVTSEIEARTAPTFLDVLVAFFGGIAGIISGSRRDKSNAIPGVAIATALMPPLCVTGFGLANGEWEIMLNSFYLFFLNAVFVALATYLIVRYLKFPYEDIVDERERRRTQLIIFFVSALLILPSVYILSGVLNKLNEKSRIEAFFQKNFRDALWETADNKKTDSLEVKLFYFGQLQEDSLAYYRDAFQQLDCRAKLDIIQTDIPRSEVDIQAFEQSMRKEMMSLLEADQKIEDEKDRKIRQLADSITLLRSDSILFRNLLEEVKVLFPDIREIGFAQSQQAASKDSTVATLPTLTVNWRTRSGAYPARRERERLSEYVRLRGDLDTLKLILY